MRCDACAHWLTERKTIYGDGSEVVTYRAPEDKGRCMRLEIDTPPEFGCTSFTAGDCHVMVATKEGAPWSYSKAGPCPDCAGKGNAGDSGCHRCAGTGKVRYYDDGYIGEEQTRLHPKERGTPIAVRRCAACSAALHDGWVACPACGLKAAPVVAETENITDEMAGLPSA